LMLDLYDALQVKGIPLLAYLPSGAPAADPVAVERLGWEWGFEGGWPQAWNTRRTGKRLAEFQTRWEAIVREWSLRWGPKGPRLVARRLLFRRRDVPACGRAEFQQLRGRASRTNWRSATQRHVAGQGGVITWDVAIQPNGLIHKRLSSANSVHRRRLGKGRTMMTERRQMPARRSIEQTSSPLASAVGRGAH
ncbi:MAG: hypothetical protein N3A66_05270, partial [Planctomycetota bacterium]|nr:hypothetical protein [Planctomycetota bacterium]